jgi:Nuclease-related domain
VFDQVYPYYCGAGRGARRKYREVSSHWRKRIFRHPWLVAAGLGAPIFVVPALEHHGRWLWLLGVMLGGLLGAYAALLESPPWPVESWRTGFEGERRTARALAPLRSRGFVLLHDLPDRRTSGRDHKGNIDHVVVSTGGVFLLDTKWLTGDVSINGDWVHVQQRDDEDDSSDLRWLASGMRGRAKRLREDIEKQADISFVKAVVVFWNRFEQGVVLGDRVVFVHGERLAGWLQAQGGELTGDRIASVAKCIADTRPREQRARWERVLRVRPWG